MKAIPLTELKPLSSALTRRLTDPGVGGGVPEGLRLLAGNGDTLITEDSNQFITE